MSIQLRPATAADADQIAPIIKAAFDGIADRHNFPYDFPNLDHALNIANWLCSDPTVWEVVAEENGKIVGSSIVAYASAPNIWQANHAVAETDEDLQAVLSGAARFTAQPLLFLLPARQARLFRWCLRNRMRVVKPMSLMAMGAYEQPSGAFLPSVLY